MSDAPGPANTTESTENAQVIPIPNPQHQITFLIKDVDGKLKAEQTIWVPDRMAAVLLSNPIIVYSKGVHIVQSQTEYDPETKTFTHPGGETEQAEEFTV